MELPEKLLVNGNLYQIKKLLGRGKGGYSYLCEREGCFYTLKQIHHEPCSYYTFGNKFLSEIQDYSRLNNAGIQIPQMIESEEKTERIVKQFIDGPTVVELIKNNGMNEDIYSQLNKMCSLAENAGLNIDYYPTNFIVEKGRLYYIDYECNNYMPEWNYENWGKKFWSRTEEFIQAFEENGEEK